MHFFNYYFLWGLQRYGLKLLQISVLDFTLAVVSLFSSVIILFSLQSLYRVYSRWRERFKRLIEVERKLLSSE
ncbi:MAG: hypothetical protein NDF54_05335 [archaeon GB-1867-035]|nr:hypothetical protein [Candidatus Culexmicrobium profundum]